MAAVKRILATMALVAVFCAESWANSGGISLREPIGARAEGMGEAFTAVADDATSIFWNVAGMNQISGIQATASYFQGLVDSSFGHVAYCQEIESFGHIGAGLAMLNGGQVSLDMPDGSYKDVLAQQDFVGNMAYAFAINPYIGFGAGVKMLHSVLSGDTTANAFGADVGVFYGLKDPLSFGACLQNLGAGIKYKDDIDPMPTTLRLGAAAKISVIQGQRCVAAVDMVKAMDQYYRYNVGVEYWIAEMLALRLGYKYGYDLEGLTAGCGFKWGMFEMDYAFNMVSDLNSTHKISLSLKLDAGQGVVVKKLETAPAVKETIAEPASVKRNDANELWKILKKYNMGTEMAVNEFLKNLDKDESVGDEEVRRVSSLYDDVKELKPQEGSEADDRYNFDLEKVQGGCLSFLQRRENKLRTGDGAKLWSIFKKHGLGTPETISAFAEEISKDVEFRGPDVAKVSALYAEVKDLKPQEGAGADDEYNQNLNQVRTACAEYLQCLENKRGAKSKIVEAFSKTEKPKRFVAVKSALSAVKGWKVNVGFDLKNASINQAPNTEDLTGKSDFVFANVPVDISPYRNKYMVLHGVLEKRYQGYFIIAHPFSAELEVLGVIPKTIVSESKATFATEYYFICALEEVVDAVTIIGAPKTMAQVKVEEIIQPEEYRQFLEYVAGHPKEFAPEKYLSISFVR